MLQFLDLRERGERLEATRLETDPTVADTVAGILQRVFVEGDDVLIELAQRFDGCDLSRERHARHRRGVRRRRGRHAAGPPRRARRPDRSPARPRRPPAPTRMDRGARRRAVRRDRPSARERGLLRARRSRRVSVVGLHDRGARGGRRRRGDRAVHAAAGRRLDPGPGAVRRDAARAPPTSPRPAARRRSAPWPTAPSRSRASTASSARATPTSPRPSDRSPARSASTDSPVRASSRSSPTATSTSTWPRST